MVTKRTSLDPKYLTPEFNKGLSIRNGQRVTVHGHEYDVLKVTRRAEFEKRGQVTLTVRKPHGVPQYSVLVNPDGSYTQPTKLF